MKIEVVFLFLLPILAFAQESNWFMLIGGINSPNSVELYNWQTGHSCDLESTPFFSYGSTGLSFDGVPVVCGVTEDAIEIFKQKCFKYDKTTKQWENIPSLLNPIYLAESVIIPRRGWYIFGGNDDIVKSQKLASLTGRWELGNDLFESRSVSQQCVVHFSNTQTAFIGGTKNPKELVIFDWTTGLYSKNANPLSRERLQAGCSTMVSNTGQLVIAILGGVNENSFEVWNPTDQSVTLITDQVPPSQGSTYGFPKPEVFSVRSGKELLLFCGFPDLRRAYSEVWKYFVDENSWSKMATLSNGKFQHTAIPVDGIECTK